MLQMSLNQKVQRQKEFTKLRWQALDRPEIHQNTFIPLISAKTGSVATKTWAFSWVVANA